MIRDLPDSLDNPEAEVQPVELERLEHQVPQAIQVRQGIQVHRDRLELGPLVTLEPQAPLVQLERQDSRASRERLDRQDQQGRLASLVTKAVKG